MEHSTTTEEETSQCPGPRWAIWEFGEGLGICAVLRKNFDDATKESNSILTREPTSRCKLGGFLERTHVTTSWTSQKA